MHNIFKRNNIAKGPTDNAQPNSPHFSSTFPNTPAKTPNNTRGLDDTFFQKADYVNFSNPPHILIIGAGSRGTSYAEATRSCSNAVIAAICEPVVYKRQAFGEKFVWGIREKKAEMEFDSWKQWVDFEEVRKKRVVAGEKVNERGVDAVMVCVLDEMHEEVVTGIAHLGVHILCEKPLATSLESCLNIYNSLMGAQEKRVAEAALNGEGRIIDEGKVRAKETIFGICHVLRYSPHNMLLRHLVLEKEVVGDVLSVEHVEPVGWWHFSHSYVRGNWRKESTTAPSLLTKSCHDIDWLMWMMCSPAPGNDSTPHLPCTITSTGSRKFFRKDRKPKEAGNSTNCLKCQYEPRCEYSALKIYNEKQLAHGNTDWPVKIVVPEIEECYKTKGPKSAESMLFDKLSEDYSEKATTSEIESRPWFGRCVWESDNDVCDDQFVTIEWEDDPINSEQDGRRVLKGRGAKSAQFHMIAFTENQCERRGRIYGTKGEVEYDSKTIRVHTFATTRTESFSPFQAGGGHGGGDEGLARQFLLAVNAVDKQEMPAATAQRKFLGCDLEEAFLSHAMVFAAEEARTQRTVVDWKQWWADRVDKQLHRR